jgi:ribosome-associated heat shock protein Hsp15
VAESLRIDKWLWFARFFKSRALAQSVIASGEVVLNGQPVTKAAQGVKVGDDVAFPTGPRRRRVVVVALGDRRGPAPEAQELYRDCDG